MKKVNGFTVYEPNDPSALDEYSEQLAEELNTEFGKKVDKIDGYDLMSDEEKEKLANLNNYDDTEIKKDIESNTINLTSLEAQNTRLKANQIPGSATGTEIEITDSAEIEASIGVGGESTQESRSGKNILDANNPTGTNLATVGFNNNILTVSSTVTNTTPFARYEFPISYGDIVRLNAIILDTNGQIVTQVYNGTTWVSVGVLTKNYIDGSSISSILYESTEGYIAIRFLFYSNKEVPTAETSARYKNAIVTKNNSNTTYEPYGAMPSPEFPSPIKNLTGNVECKVRGKNLWNNELENAEYDVNGNKIATLIWLVNQVPINVKPNTQYTISQVEKPSQYRIICFKDYNYLSRINNTQDTSSGYVSYTFTTPANCNKIFIQFRSTLENIAKGTYYMSTTSITEVQLEKGTKTEIEPYKETTVTFPLLEGQALRKDGDLAEDGICNARTDITLTRANGNWDFGYNYSANNKIVVSARLGLNVAGSGIRTDFLCSHFKTDNTVYATNDNLGCYINSAGNINFAISYNTIGATAENTKTELLELFLTWLDNNPITIEYPLPEPTTTPYTTEQKKAWDKLQNFLLYKGYNYIEMVAENGVKANLEVNYIKSTEMYVKSLEERIQALENAVLS